MSRPKKEPKREDNTLDVQLRPQTWDEYIGQEKVKQNLMIIIEAAKQRKETPEHLLFYGPSGIGKTSLAYLVAKETGNNIHVTAGPAIEKSGDLAAILTNLSDGDVLFCDEIHRLNKTLEEYLYPAMEDSKLNLTLGRGPMASTMEMKLSHFTLIGATTRPALLSGPLRSRFGAIFGLSFYKISDIKKILRRSASILNVEAEENALEIIAKCSRLTPRTANHLLRRVRDFAQVKGKGIITKKLTEEAFRALEIDRLGLTLGDRRILKIIIEKFNGGPVGLQALAATSSEEKDTILEIYEPYLLQLGFIERTPKGRTITELAYKHLGLKHPLNQNVLFN